MNRDSRASLADCPEDGLLVAFLDGALDETPDAAPDTSEGRSEPGVRHGGVGAPAIRAHLERCEACRARLEAIRARSELVRSWLRRHDPPPPPLHAYDLEAGSRRGGLRRWAVAAVILILAGVVAAPGIAWVAQRIQSTADDGPPQRLETPADPDIVHSTSFVPASAELEVSFRAPDTRGTLVLDRATDARVTVEVPGAGIGLTVSGDRLEIDNRAAPEGMHRLLIPRGLTIVRIMVPGAGPRVVMVEGEESLPQRLELGGASQER